MVVHWRIGITESAINRQSRESVVLNPILRALRTGILNTPRVGPFGQGQFCVTKVVLFLVLTRWSVWFYDDDDDAAVASRLCVLVIISSTPNSYYCSITTAYSPSEYATWKSEIDSA